MLESDRPCESFLLQLAYLLWHFSSFNLLQQARGSDKTCQIKQTKYIHTSTKFTKNMSSLGTFTPWKQNFIPPPMKNKVTFTWTHTKRPCTPKKILIKTNVIVFTTLFLLRHYLKQTKNVITLSFLFSTWKTKSSLHDHHTERVSSEICVV